MGEIKFKRGLQENYDNISSKDQDTVYFCTDTATIYMDGVEYTGTDWDDFSDDTSGGGGGF